MNTDQEPPRCAQLPARAPRLRQVFWLSVFIPFHPWLKRCFRFSIRRWNPVFRARHSPLLQVTGSRPKAHPSLRLGGLAAWREILGGGGSRKDAKTSRSEAN